MYEILDDIVLGKKIYEEINWFIKNSPDKKGKLGLIDPFHIIEKLTKEDLKNILTKFKITKLPDSKRDLILILYKNIRKRFNSEEIKTRFGDPIDYLGNLLYNTPKLKPYFEKFDVVSLHELIEIFGDFCADLNFNVYDLTKEKIPGQLFLAQKIHTPMNQIAILIRGHEISKKYDNIVGRLVEASKYSDWIIFVTTSLAVLEKRWNKLVEDMKNIGAWVYLIDPFHGMIYGILKGKKSNSKSVEKEDVLIESLETPVKVPDLKKRVSKYSFDEKFEYKSDNFVVFGKNIYPPKSFQLEYIENDRKNLQYLILTHTPSGKRLDSLIWTIHPPEPDLITGFIHAIDSFGKTLADSKGLEEIKYKDFIICCIEREYAKAYLFLKEMPSPRLKELLIIGLEKWEDLFENELKIFIGKLDPFVDRHLETFHLFNRLFLGTD